MECMCASEFVAGVLVPVNQIPFLIGTVEAVASSLGCNSSWSNSMVVVGMG